MRIYDGKIVETDDYDGEETLYEIELITIEMAEDIPDVIGIVRCTGITIESNAPSEIKSDAELVLYNELADEEYNDANGDGMYESDVKQTISERTGVDISQIEIERL